MNAVAERGDESDTRATPNEVPSEAPSEAQLLDDGSEVLQVIGKVEAGVEGA